MSANLVEYYRDKGVEMRIGEGMTGLESSGGKVVIKTSSGKAISADLAVAGLGIVPNTELAQQAGLRVDNGIVVDEHLRTNVSDIYAAGDVANFYNPALDMRMRVEHEDNANTMGRASGRALAVVPERDHTRPCLSSDPFEPGR